MTAVVVKMPRTISVAQWLDVRQRNNTVANRTLELDIWIYEEQNVKVRNSLGMNLTDICTCWAILEVLCS